jgi:hypothetical protein
MSNTKVVIFISILAVAVFYLFSTSFIYNKQANSPIGGTNTIKDQYIEPVQKKIYGYSQGNRLIEGYEIGLGENVILLLGATHGDEKTSADLLNRFIEQMKTDFSLVSTTKKVIVIPVVNPDGYYERDDNLNANGVNLNRNFETTEWKQYQPGGTFAGPRPFSEIESQTIKKVVEEYKPSMMISFHAQGSLVSPELGQASSELGKWYADKTGYTYWDEWNEAGTATKWFAEVIGNPAITVELQRHLELGDDWEKNKGALLELIS